MNFIKKIYDKKADEKVHLQFQKFSKGYFKDKALIDAKYAGGKYTINTSPEFANELVRVVAEKLDDKKTKVTGAIVSTSNLKEESEFKELLGDAEVKQFQGVKRFIINKKISGKEILNILEKNPKTFFALSFDSEDCKLKIKPKAPKSGKPSSKGDVAPKADFCKLITQDKEIAKDFIFEKPDFKKARVNHEFLIEELIYPENETDYSKIRELAKRKGKIIRKSEIDGEEKKLEINFEA